MSINIFDLAIIKERRDPLDEIESWQDNLVPDHLLTDIYN